MRINSRKILKILERVQTTPKCILKPFALMNTQMHRHECNTHTFLFDSKNQTMIFFL
jgi:hypothetical protein